MRVLVGTIRFFPDVAGGGNRIAFDTARYLVSQGHDVVLLCEGIPGKPESEIVAGLRVLRYSIHPFDLNFITRHQRAAKRVLRRQLGDWRPELVWGHMQLQMSAMIDAFPAARMTYTMHSPVSAETMASETAFPLKLDLVLKSKILFRIEKRCCQAASVITVLSEFTKSEIRRMHGDAIASKVKITHGWADVHRFHPQSSRNALKSDLDWPTDRTVFYCIRRFVARMGLDNLIMAAAMVRDHGLRFHLYIAGQGPLRRALESQISELRLEDCVRILGAVSEEQLAAMYAAADAVVVPTRELECFGLIAVEAMSAGTPVLSTPVGALPEIIGRIEPGWLSRDNSAQAMAELMIGYLERRLNAHSEQEIRGFVLENYDQDKALPAMVRAATDVGM